MFRRRSTDDEALAEAYRRLDGASTASAPAPSPVTASSLAEAARVDAALRGLLQPVAAPDTLAGRVAGEIGRARVARWRRGSGAARRPVWAMAFAGAVVVVLVVGTALATLPGGGTIQERARGVGEWVRAVLGVGVLEKGEQDGAVMHWVPGLGIVALAPDAFVSTGPVTATVSGFDVVIEGLVSDQHGTRMAVRMVDVEPPVERRDDEQLSLTLYPMTGDEEFGLNDEGLTCSVWTYLLATQSCSVPPVSVAQRQRGDAGFYVEPAHEIGYIKQHYLGLPVEWNPELLKVRVPLVAAADAGDVFPLARRSGDVVEHGGLRLQAWVAQAEGGQLAVRLAAVSIGHADQIAFTALKNGPDPDPFHNDQADPYDAISLVRHGQPDIQPIAVYSHVDDETGTPAEFGLRIPDLNGRDPSGRMYRWSLPVTAVFGTDVGPQPRPIQLSVGPLAWHVDSLLRNYDDGFEAFDGASLSIQTAGRAVWNEPMRGWKGHTYDASFALTETLSIAGTPVRVDRAMRDYTHADNGTPEQDRQHSLLLRWKAVPIGDRVLHNMEVGVIESTMLDWPPFRRTCNVMVGYVRRDGGDSDNTISVQLGVDPPPTAELCFIQPVSVIHGPWVFALPQP